MTAGIHTADVARGPRDAEARLLHVVAKLIPDSPGDLTRPVRIVVPSKVLRRHVAAMLIRHHGRAIVGLSVQTLYALAVEILERTETVPGGTGSIFWLLCRRLADEEPELKRALSAYADGYRVALAAVRDLLDAGLEPFHVGPLLEAIEEVEVPAGMKRRAAALVRLAGRALEAGERFGIAPPPAVMQRAAERLANAGSEVLPCRAVIVTGFGEVTGVAGDLLERLIGLFPSVLIVDRPPEPAHREREAMAARFTDRLLERMAGITGSPAAGELPGPSAVIEAFEAPDRDAEVREVGRRIRELLDTGRDPGGIGIVVRDLRGWEATFFRTFDRLGIPFSAPGLLLPSGPAARLGQVIRGFLEKGTACPADLWLEAATGAGPGATARLIRAIREAGAGTLGELAAFRPDDVTRWSQRTGKHTTGPVSIEALRDAVTTARRAVAILQEGGDRRAATDWRATLERIVDLLGTSNADDDQTLLRAQLADVLGRVPSGLILTLEEVRMLVEPVLLRAGERGLGGRGGGVRVLSAMEARGVTFEHLFLAGLVRDVFPRVVREDPLMPDRFRIRLQQDFPDVPVKGQGWTEEAYLFASLVSSASHVCLSWATRNGAGQPVARSSFVERMILEGGLEVQSVPAVYPAVRTNGFNADPVRPAHEWAILAGLEGERNGLEAAMAASIHEGRERAAVHRWAAEPGRVATARYAVLREREARWKDAGPGPWAGLLAQPPPGADGEQVWVTTLEQLATCPWQALVEKVLRVTSPADPLVDLPDLDPALVGSVVHAVLAELAVRAGAPARATLGKLEGVEPRSLQHPGAATLEKILSGQAEKLALSQGIRSPAVAAMLVERARPFVELALNLEVEGEPPHVIGAEINGAVQMEAGFDLRFRADRVDRGPEGLILTDYKTGKPVSQGAKEDTRRKHLLAEIASGRLLQGVAYAAGAGNGAVGRYLFLKLDDRLTRDIRDVRIRAKDRIFTETFEKAGEVLWRMWQTGACFPRVEEAGTRGKPGAACAFCRVKEVCLKDDSAYRRRVAAWMESAADHRMPSAVERAARDGWWLGRKKRT